MNARRFGRSQRGFTLVEMMVVFAILSVLALMITPAIQETIRRSQLTGAAQQSAAVMRLARLTAIRRSRPAIVQVLPTGEGWGEVRAFLDLDADGDYDADEPVLSFFPLGRGVRFVNPDGDVGVDSVDGFTGAGKLAVFQADGSVESVGALRLADQRGNFLEVRVEPAATARVEIRKWQEASGTPRWVAARQGGEAWTWH
jgi:prepilin-type N-terminal cleavage/methylation domain-containing protein